MPKELNTSLMLDRYAITLIAEIVEAAMAEAKRLDLKISSDEQEARRYLTKRVILAIERGETDLLKLRDLALMPSHP